MSRLSRDLSSGTYVMNSDTSRGTDRNIRPEYLNGFSSAVLYAFRRRSGSHLSEHGAEVGADGRIGGRHGLQLSGGESELDGEAKRVDHF